MKAGKLCTGHAEVAHGGALMSTAAGVRNDGSSCFPKHDRQKVAAFFSNAALLEDVDPEVCNSVA